MQPTARAFGVCLLVFNVTAESEIAPVFATLVEHHAGAIVVGGATIVLSKRDQILSHAARFALPTMFPYSREARAGALLSYGPDLPRTFRPMWVHTGRILKCEKPT